MYPLLQDDPAPVVAETIRRADNYRTLIVLPTMEVGALHALLETESPAGTLDAVAAGSVVVATRAYDMQGWAIWTDGVPV